MQRIHIRPIISNITPTIYDNSINYQESYPRQDNWLPMLDKQSPASNTKSTQSECCISILKQVIYLVWKFTNFCSTKNVLLNGFLRSYSQSEINSYGHSGSLFGRIPRST